MFSYQTAWTHSLIASRSRDKKDSYDKYQSMNFSSFSVLAWQPTTWYANNYLLMLLLSDSDFDAILCSCAVEQILKFGSLFSKVVRKQFVLSTKPMETIPQISKRAYDTCKTLEPGLCVYEHQRCPYYRDVAGW